MPAPSDIWVLVLVFFSAIPILETTRILQNTLHISNDDSPIYIWPLPKQFEHGNSTLSVDPNLSLHIKGLGANSDILREAFERYKGIIFGYRANGRKGSDGIRVSDEGEVYDVTGLNLVIASGDETLQFGVDESYILYVGGEDEESIVGGVNIEANTVYGALRGMETFSQLCRFNYMEKNIEIHKAPWYIIDEPKFPFRGLLLDTSRHFLPVKVIKQVIDSMSYAKLNVLHWHIVDEESFPIEVPSYPHLWRGSYTKWEKFTVEDAYEIVDYAKKRGVNVMSEVDVPGHAESWGAGYPDLWPSKTCREPLDVSKNLTFKIISGILSDFRKIFPFELFHLGGDEVNTDCWNLTPHVKRWLQDHNMTAKDAYQYFVLKAQDIAISQNWIPINWEETFTSFKENLNPQTVVHNWLTDGVCVNAVAKGFRCIASNQAFWYLDHLDIQWEDFYTYDPLEGIQDASQQKLVIGGEVCMWGETADTSDVQQTIWPRAAAAAERLWNGIEATNTFGNISSNVFPRLEYFRCLLNKRGIAAAPVSNRILI